MKAKTFTASSVDEALKAINEAIKVDFKPTLAMVFISIKQNNHAICEALDKEGIAVFGSTTSGEFIDGHIGDGSIAIMLLELDRSTFKIAFHETGSLTTKDIAKHIGEEGKASFIKPAFIVASGGIATDGEVIVAGIEEAVGAEVTIFGGMAGDDLNLTETFVFSNGKLSNNALVAIIFNEDKIAIKGMATNGWKPVGNTRVVTKSKGNLVYTIDDEPALDVVIKYMGVTIDLDSKKDVVVNIGAYFPLQLDRDDAPPVMRTIMLVNKEDRSLICAGNVPQGSKLRFSLPPDFDVIDHVVEECNDLKNVGSREADALLIFSCVSRHLSFGEMAGEEINRIKKVWDVPLIGFFSYGEIGRSIKGKHEFHNNTCCIVVLKEN
ncbi:MAG: FIST N-terminal domain-containing protein [Ginsengibacter sp.]